MRTIIQNANLLSSLQPKQVASYLQAKGWHEQNKVDDKASIWTLETESKQNFEVLLPLDPKFRDFLLRIYEVVQTLELVEHRSTFEILGDLITQATNIQVQGVVVKLEEANQTGKVTLMGCAVGKFRKIHLQLSRTDRNLAIKAYQERLPIVCYGDLIKEGDMTWLKNTHNFALHPAEWTN